MTIDGEQHRLSPLFTVFATENPIEYEGTYPLPEAQLDRFLLKILIDYPSPEEEAQVVSNWDAGFNARRLEQIDIRPLAEPDAVMHCRAEVRAARMEPGVQRYLVEIVRRTREHPAVAYGASPRASRRAAAVLEGARRDARSRLRHARRRARRRAPRRCVTASALRAEAELDGATPDAVITDILNTVEVPR